MWLLWLADLDVPSGSLTCAVTPPHPVLRVSIRLASRQINATLYRIFFSSMLGQSQYLRRIAFNELAKAPPRIILSSFRRRTLCPRGKIPQQFVIRLFVSLECVNFERGPLLTFESAILRLLLLVVQFGRAEQSLYPPLIFSLASLHPFVLNKIVFVTHSG